MTMANDISYSYEQRLIADLAKGALKEQRSRRRWGIFFKLLFFSYIIFITVLVIRTDTPDTELNGDFDGKGHAAVVDIEGIIYANSDTSARHVNSQLRRAFRNQQAKGIILNINSPGGSAVESNRIYREIRRLREKYPEKKVYAVAGDFCASGGYFIAAAADAIYVDDASIVGSIGVIFASFGFVEAMEKLGIERRVITAGENKNKLDPFSPQGQTEVVELEDILADVHTVFTEAVKEGRGDALADADASIFSGKIYSGTESIRLGLADDIGSVAQVARDIIGVENVVYYGQRDFFQKFVENFRLLFGQGGVLAKLP